MSTQTQHMSILTSVTVATLDGGEQYEVRIGVTHRLLGRIEHLPSGYTAKVVGADASAIHLHDLQDAVTHVVHSALVHAARNGADKEKTTHG